MRIARPSRGHGWTSQAWKIEVLGRLLREAAKRDRVVQLTERGYPIREVSECPGVSPHSLYACTKTFAKLFMDNAFSFWHLNLQCQPLRPVKPRFLVLPHDKRLTVSDIPNRR